MKTRNQLSTSKVAAAGANATNQVNNNEITSDTPPSPPRLRDRKVSVPETKASNTPAMAAVALPMNHSPSPPNMGAKRPLSGPTRILPRRSCGRQNSLLADNQPNSCAISNKTKLMNSSKSAEQSSSRKDTHKQSISLVREVSCKTDQSTSDVCTKTAASKNQIAEAPRTSKTVPSISNQNELSNAVRETSNTKQLHEPVRISLPDPNDKTKSLRSVCDAAKGTNSKIVALVSAQDKEPTQDDTRVNLLDLRTERDTSSNPQTNEISSKKTFNILIGVTGSVATIKLIELVKKIKSMFPRPYSSKPNDATFEAVTEIKIVMTKNSLHFAPKEELTSKLSDYNIEIYDDSDEWSLWKRINDPVLHIDLRKWADLFLIAPLDANTMAKLANGLCDNLLTCIVRAWDLTKPLIYCPAMNVHMYSHPITREHLCKLQSFGYLRVDCVEKRLACGDVGLGGMAPVESIANKVVDTLIQPATRKLSLTKPLLTQQPTYPIISTSEDDDQGNCQTGSKYSPSISNQILNRFRTNNQITIHPVAVNGIGRNSSESLVSGESLLKKQGNVNSFRTSNGFYIVNDNRKNGHHINNNGKHVMGGVTSVRNLKAMGLDNSFERASSIEDEMEVDFDPSKILEQSMVTDESLIITNHDQTIDALSSNSTDFSFDRDSSVGQGGSVAKVGCVTPLFNTSKFLALCYNKERGCFTCTICKHDYKNRKSMARHLKEQHVQGNIYQCKPCGVSYKRREKLIKHNRERHQVI